MKIQIVILFLIVPLTVTGQTNLYIVGTVHARTKNFNPDSVLNILSKLKPDLILVELDSSFFDDEFNLKIRTPTNETIGIKKYVSKRPTPIRPYDVRGRKRAINVIEVEAESLDRISSIKQRLDASQRQTYIDFKRTNEEVISFLKKKPREINQIYTNVLVEQNQLLMYKGLLEIIESRSELDDLKVGYRQCGVFWDYRNKRMVQHILSFLNMDVFRNKTIVLFTGFIHKYYLLNQLMPKQEMGGFVIKEYYE
ncbi:MAG: hypothetical protein WA958_04240 [Tunicatimonas sp.]